jgi:hypothetical protein
MTFDHARGLWLLALGLPILALHFYRGRIRRLAVPNLLFWEQVIVEEDLRTALRRIRDWASLLLNLLALLVLTSAVTGPRVKGISRPRHRYALVIDNRPAMGAQEPDGRTRQALATERAREFIVSLGYGDQVALYDQRGLQVPFSEDLERTARRLSTPPLVVGPGIRERIQEAMSSGDDVEVILFSDQLPRGAEDLLAQGRLRLARVGTPLDNVGWVSGLAARRPGENKVTLSLDVANFSGRPAQRFHLLHFNRKELARREVTLEPGKRVNVEWKLDPAAYPGAKIEEGGLVEVMLEPRDAFPADDVASFVIPPLVPPTVIVFHPGKPDEFLMRSLESLKAGGLIHPNILLAPAARYLELRSRLGEGWIVIFDRVARPAMLGYGAFLILGAPNGKLVERPAVLDWDREAPPNHLIEYSGLLIRRSRILAGLPLLRSAEGPLGVWSSEGGQVRVELGFGFEDCDPRPALPMMLFNFVEWGAYRGTRAYRTEYRVGEPLRQERPLWISHGELSVIQSDRDERLRVIEGQAEAAPPGQPGFVKFSASGRSEWAAVNVFNAETSDLREHDGGAPGAPLPPPAPWHARLPFALLAAGAGLLILLLEWALFQRGAI